MPPGWSLDGRWMVVGCLLDGRWMVVGCLLDGLPMLFRLVSEGRSVAGGGRQGTGRRHLVNCSLPPGGSLDMQLIPDRGICFLLRLRRLELVLKLFLIY
jgi:hypothetical protein